MTTKYVAGFLVRGEEILLVRKTHPNWQKGLLNGIGGHVDDRETYVNAMRREFLEETGLEINDWDPFASERGPGYIVMFYRHILKTAVYEWNPPPMNDKHEELRWHKMDNLERMEVVGNLQWLLPMVLDPRPLLATVTTTGSIKDQPTW